MTGPRLSPQDIEYFKWRMVPDGTPVRFLYRGQCLNILTGALQKKGINVIFQRHYWNFTKETAKEIALRLGRDVQPVFSE
jgi:hypothetical protein